MTNIANLPQMSGSYAVSVNADWRDVIQFTWGPGTDQAGLPIDLTGIRFFQEVRTADGVTIRLNMSTDNELLLNGGDMGTLTYAVPRDPPENGVACSTSHLTAGTNYITDLIAVGDGKMINLMQVAGPAQVVATKGVTSSATLTAPT